MNSQSLEHIKISSSKIDSLQIMRGYAAVIVAMCHIWNDGWLPGTVLEMGGFGVDLFFVLSGFIMCLTVRLHSTSNLDDAIYFLKKRFVRIFPIFIICTIPLLIYVSIDHIFPLHFYVGNLLLLPSFTNKTGYFLVLGPGWSLVYEMFFYYVFAAFMLITSSKKKLSILLITFLLALVIFIRAFGLQGPQLTLVNFSYMIGDTIMLNFALGIVVFFIYDYFRLRLNFPIHKSILWLLFWAFISAVLIYLKFPRFVSNAIPAFFITIVFTLTNNSSTQNNLIKKAVFLGDASYSIYLTHFYFVLIKPKILSLNEYFTISPEVYNNLAGIILFVLSIIGGCLFYLWVEKPIIKYFAKKVKASNTNPAKSPQIT